MKRLIMLAVVFYIAFALYIAQADTQCHFGHVPWPLDGC